MSSNAPPTGNANSVIETLGDYTSSGCAIATPFRCSQLEYLDCRALPYTSYSALFDQACSTQLQHISNIATQHYMGKCLSPTLPYSCGDGSCVASLDACATCTYFCKTVERCMSSKADCDALD